MTGILKLEKRLGFKWERGISMTASESRLVPALRDLLDDIQELKEDFAHGTSKSLRRSISFQTRCEDLFIRYADRLWPMEPVDTNGWLVDARLNTWDGLYPKMLAYRNTEDQDILCHNFHALLFEKCVAYQKRLLQKKPNDSEDASPSQAEAEDRENDDDEQEERDDDLYNVSDYEVSVRQKRLAAPANVDHAPARSLHHIQQQVATPFPLDGNLAPIAQMIPMGDRALLADRRNGSERHIPKTDSIPQVRKSYSGTTTWPRKIAIKGAPSPGCSSQESTTQYDKSSTSTLGKRAYSVISEDHGFYECKANTKRESQLHRTRSKIVRLELTADKLKTFTPADKHIVATGTCQPSPAVPPQLTQQDPVIGSGPPIEAHQPQLIKGPSNSAIADGLISTQGRHTKSIDTTTTSYPSTIAQHATPSSSQALTNTASATPTGHKSEDSGGQHPAKPNFTESQPSKPMTNSELQLNGSSSSKTGQTKQISMTVNCETIAHKSGVTGLAAMTLRFDPIIHHPERPAKMVAVQLAEHALEGYSGRVKVVDGKEDQKTISAEPQALEVGQASRTQEQAAEVPISSERKQGHRLAIQLRSATVESDVQQFAIVNMGSSVEQLLLKIQQRMSRRLDGKEVQFVNLYLPGEDDAWSAYRVEKDDPDTWEIFVDLLKGQSKDGEKVRIVADVEA